ncbi:MAG: hypothetical protein KBD16_03560 [Candidatus Pacebacteria bacterium]|nr:hypothetical protein [Candidatus Paceibacterota bacterium]
MDYVTEARAIAFSPLVLWSILGIVFLVWIGMSAILLFHWNSYSKGSVRTSRMKKIFFIGSLVLFLSAISFIFSV